MSSFPFINYCHNYGYLPPPFFLMGPCILGITLKRSTLHRHFKTLWHLVSFSVCYFNYHHNNFDVKCNLSHQTVQINTQVGGWCICNMQLFEQNIYSLICMADFFLWYLYRLMKICVNQGILSSLCKLSKTIDFPQ